MADKLSAASLLLTAVAIIYSLWYPEIAKALKITPQTHKPDNRSDFKEVGRIFATRSLPLFVISLILVIVFAPDTIDILRRTANILTTGQRAQSRYDAVAASFVCVSGLTLLFTIHLGILASQLIGLRRRLNPNG